MKTFLHKRNIGTLILSILLISNSIMAQVEIQKKDRFAQLSDLLATPNEYRTAAGTPGHKYWQQRADYDIKVRIDESKQVLYGSETITYFNNSPDTLTYIWVQLDQNIRKKESIFNTYKNLHFTKEFDMRNLNYLHEDFVGGNNLEKVVDSNNKPLKYTVVETNMRIELPNTLAPGGNVKFQIDWNYNITTNRLTHARSGAEYFEKDKNYVFAIAQFYPRMCVYNDVEGWQNKPFIESGEFTLTFGNFNVEITVPADHIVSATGELQNGNLVLTQKQRDLLEKSKTASLPVVIVSEQEAKENEKEADPNMKTWKFAAKNVRDFAFASSRKFIWDAQGITVGGKLVMCMSFYPKEGNPVWGDHATKQVINTINGFSKYSLNYPYPVAQAINVDEIGMEYPMICFNDGRPSENGEWDENTVNWVKMIINHEVGHNFFPMIINTDERQFSWMDEGMNTFVQTLVEQDNNTNFPSWIIPTYRLDKYMYSLKDSHVPIMANSESCPDHNFLAYFKPAAALMVLRNYVMGADAFDYAFREYARRWAFKQPYPEDFFRTMEDASGMDLDWFWRGWFYSNEYVDVAIANLQIYKFDADTKKLNANVDSAIFVRNLDYATYKKEYSYIEADKKDFNIKDFYYSNVGIENYGGLVMPLLLIVTFDDNSTATYKIPVEFWQKENDKGGKILVTKKRPIKFILNPKNEIIDTEMSNNVCPK